jgi:hypothetical protein
MFLTFFLLSSWLRKKYNILSLKKRLSISICYQNFEFYSVDVLFSTFCSVDVLWCRRFVMSTFCHSTFCFRRFAIRRFVNRRFVCAIAINNEISKIFSDSACEWWSCAIILQSQKEILSRDLIMKTISRCSSDIWKGKWDKESRCYPEQITNCI